MTCATGPDRFQFLDYELIRGRHFVIRSAKDRKLAGETSTTWPPATVSIGRCTPTPATCRRWGRGTWRCRRRRASPGPRRDAGRLVRAAASCGCCDFARGHCQGEPLDLWVVHVLETDPPPAVRPLEWVLLTDLAADTFARACERIDWYACRPLIEDYHKGMKSGVRVELLQLEHAGRLEPVIGPLRVVAAELLRLRHATRHADADLMPAPCWSRG